MSLLSGEDAWPRTAYQSGLMELVVYPLLLYTAVRSLASTRRLCHALMLCAFAGGVLVAILGLAGWLRGAGVQVDGVLRLLGPYYSPNHTALYLLRTLFLGLGIALAAGGAWTRWLGLLAILVVVTALALTASRGAWLLGMPAGVAFCILWWRIEKSGATAITRRTTLIMSVAIVALLAGVFLLLGSRLTNSATIASRWSIWRNAWQLWLDHWLVGVGPGGFFWRYPAYLAQFTNEPNIVHPHNVWLEVAATWGVVGWLWLVALLAFVVQAVQWVHTLESSRETWLVAGGVAGLVAALAHAQVDTFWLLPDLAAWNWLVLGLLANAKRIL